MGGPTSSYATAGIALRVISVLKPPHHDKVEIPRGGLIFVESLILNDVGQDMKGSVRQEFWL